MDALEDYAMNEASSTSEDAFIAKLRQFYESTLFQHKVSFLASIFAAAVGLLAVVLGVLAYLSNPANLSESVILGVSGVFAEFIGAAFLHIHNKSIEQAYTGFEKLVKLQDTQLAINLVKHMDEKNHDYMYMNIINVLMLRNEQNRDLTPDLVRALRETGKA
jgi:hypothetical protein